MEENEVKALLAGTLVFDDIIVETQDGKHFTIIAVSAEFEGMSRLKQHQLVYNQLMVPIQQNDIHAVSIKTYTPQVWERDKKLMSF